MADRVANVFRFAGEDVIAWQNDGLADRNGNYGYDHSYVLVFQKTEA